MLIAHLPSGYILGRAWPGRAGRARAVLIAVLVGSVIPDIDMLYFHLMDGGRTHHHDYPTHWPLVWLTAGILGVLLSAWLRPRWMAPTAAFFAAAMMHMAMDSIAAPIGWLRPFSDWRIELVRVPAAYSHWIISFLLHWTFALELTICAVALCMFWRSRQVSRQGLAGTVASGPK